VNRDGAITLNDGGAAGEGITADGVSGWAPEGGTGVAAASSSAAGDLRDCCRFAGLEVGLDEFFPFVGREGAVDGMFEGSVFVGHCGFPSFLDTAKTTVALKIAATLPELEYVRKLRHQVGREASFGALHR
jgi:hypothetical protein